MHPLRRALVGLIDAAGALGAFCVFCIFVLMIIAGVGRQLNLQVSGVNDVVAWLCAAAAFFAMAHAFRHGDFVRVTLLLEAVSPQVRRGLDVTCLVIAAIAVGVAEALVPRVADLGVSLAVIGTPAEETGGGKVEPVEVVDDDQQRCLAARRLEDGVERERHRRRLGRVTISAADGALQRRGVVFWQRRPRSRWYSVEEQ